MAVLDLPIEQSSHMPRSGSRVIFRDSKGHFLPHSHRYLPEVALVQAWRHGRYVTLAERPLPPSDLANVLSRPEFEDLKEATVPLRDYTSKSKYKAWDIAEQIDRTKGLRRKDLKMIVTIKDGNRQKKLTIYHRIKRNTSSSYRLFQRINEELGFAKMFLYNTVNGKHLSDRKGKKVSLVKIELQEVL